MNERSGAGISVHTVVLHGAECLYPPMSPMINCKRKTLVAPSGRPSLSILLAVAAYIAELINHWVT